MIRIENLGFHYRKSDFRLRIDELSILRGEALAVVGPSGSGKTTLLNLLCGLLLPETGHVVVDGVDVSALHDRARREFRIRNVGLVFQEFELLEYLSVLDNILLPLRIHPGLRPNQAYRDRAAELARRTGMGPKLHVGPRRLSQGERQRVAICRAVLMRPPVILADEPTGDLDPKTKQRVLDLLFACAAETDATMVTVTHDRGILDRFQQVVDCGDFHDGTPPDVRRPDDQELKDRS